MEANSQDDNYTRDCAQLGEMFLKPDGQAHIIASAIDSYSGKPDLQCFEVANADNTIRYRIIFAIEEI